MLSTHINMNIDSIKSTNDVLTRLYSLSKNESGFRFRGQAVFDWAIKPSIHRLYNFLRYQTVIYEEFILCGKPKTPQPPLTHTTFDLEWLMICQHYGVPTRLLDWSSDILVSLFFACADQEHSDVDGALFVCNKDNYPIFAAYDADAMETQDLAFVSTNVVNPRMRAQSGCFMIWGHAPLGNESTETYDLLEHERKHYESSYHAKICVPRGRKQQILEELKTIYSITQDTLYINNSCYVDKYANFLAHLKEDARLMVTYVCDAGTLTSDEKNKARSMCHIECENMLSDCPNIRMIKNLMPIIGYDRFCSALAERS